VALGACGSSSPFMGQLVKKKGRKKGRGGGSRAQLPTTFHQYFTGGKKKGKKRGEGGERGGEGECAGPSWTPSRF